MADALDGDFSMSLALQQVGLIQNYNGHCKEVLF